jgi:hypothetical protein
MKFLVSLLVIVSPIIAFGQTTFVPDDNFEQALIDLGYDSGPLNNYVPTGNINSVQTLNISSLNIVDMTGIQDFYSLESLQCYENSFKTLDLSYNFNLQSLSTSFNDSLEYLDLRNGNNQIFQIFSIYYTAGLECILVDDVAHFNSTFSQTLSQGKSYNTVCDFNYTKIPDLNFENVLNDLWYDNLINGKILTASIDTITKLDVSGEDIQDLSGIEAFVALEELRCQDNQLLDLDLSSNPNLNLLLCNDNTLNNLNVKNGNNENMFFCVLINNPDLTCVTVDNVNYANDTWILRDGQTHFSGQCIVGLEDYEFENNVSFLLTDLILNIKSNQEFSYSVCDLNGRVVKNNLNVNSFETVINLNSLVSGIYVVSVVTESGITSRKIRVI